MLILILIFCLLYFILLIKKINNKNIKLTVNFLIKKKKEKEKKENKKNKKTYELLIFSLLLLSRINLIVFDTFWTF